MQDVLTRKLEGYEALSDADRRVLRDLIVKVRQVGPRTDLISEGDAPEYVHLIIDGFACRYKMLPDGQRQNMAFLVPGDFCDLNVFILDRMDHTIATVSACQVVYIPRASIDTLTDNHPSIMRALWWCTLVDTAVLREWIINIGSRQADQRVAHLLCELRVRLDAVGLVKDNRYAFPFRQTEVADTLGLSEVHVNRTLMLLRERKLITLKHRELTILDVEKLQASCGFTQNYLHLKNARWADRRKSAWLAQGRGD